jgi:hypothetical protein
MVDDKAATQLKRSLASPQPEVVVGAASGYCGRGGLKSAAICAVITFIA